MSRSPHRLVAAAIAAAAAISVSIVVGSSGDVGAVPAVPRQHRVAVFSDSVGLGARHAIPAAFPADWEVNVLGEPARFVEQLESGPCFWTLTNQRCDVKFRLAANPEWFGDHVVIAAGYNYPYWDPARFDRSIDSMVTTLTNAGVKHVYWVTLREVKPQYVSGSAWRQVQPYYWYFPTVNEHLEKAVERHPNLTLVDWAAVADRTGITYDAIHLNNEGAALYAEQIRAAVASASTRVENGSTTRIPIPDSDGVTAVAINVTTTEPRRRGFLTASDCSEPRPFISSHNFVRSQTIGHATIVPVSADGHICIHASASTNMVVDLIGRFTGAVETGPSERLLDTRDGGGAPVAPRTPIEVDVGSDATAVFTITTVGAARPGWARVVPCDEIADAATANVNATGPAPTPNAAVARPAPDGTLCVMASMRTHLVLDRLTGFPEPSGIVVEPADRAIDTRDSRPLAPGRTLRLTAADLGIDDDPDTTGVLLNLTGTRSGRGWVAAFGCDDGPGGTSSLNVSPSGSVGNFTVVAPDGDGEVCFVSSTTTDLVVDVQGRTTSGFEADDQRLLDTRE